MKANAHKRFLCFLTTMASSTLVTLMLLTLLATSALAQAPGSAPASSPIKSPSLTSSPPSQAAAPTSKPPTPFLAPTPSATPALRQPGLRLLPFQCADRYSLSQTAAHSTLQSLSLTISASAAGLPTVPLVWMAEKVLQMLFAFYCKSRGILQDASYFKDKKHIIFGIETVVNRPTWIPSKNHPFIANIDAVVQSY